MSALILDAGALVAVDRDDRAMVARLRAAQQHGLDLRSNAIVIAQVWRDPHGRQVSLARLLHAVDVHTVTPQDGRKAGVLQATAGTSDPIDATVVLLAAPGDRILTSDPSDLTRLAEAAGNRPVIVACLSPRTNHQRQMRMLNARLIRVIMVERRRQRTTPCSMPVTTCNTMGWDDGAVSRANSPLAGGQAGRPRCDRHPP